MSSEQTNPRLSSPRLPPHSLSKENVQGEWPAKSDNPHHQPKTPRESTNSGLFQAPTLDTQVEEGSSKDVLNLCQLLEHDATDENDGKLDELDALLVHMDAQTLSRPRNRLLRTPLHIAAERGCDEAVRKLIISGASVFTEDHFGQTPLTLACAGSHPSVVEELIRAGADVNHQDAQYLSPLMIASRSGSAEIISLLVKAEANPEAKDGDGWTALHFACWRGNIDAARVLLDQAASDPNVNDTWKGLTPLGMAIDYGQWKMAEFLLKYEGDHPESAQMEVEFSMAANATRNDESRTLKALLYSRCGLQGQLEARNQDGETLLLTAARLGARSAFNVLLDAGADPNATYKSTREDVLMTTCRLGQPDMAKRLLDLRARTTVDARNINGMTALHIACSPNARESLDQQVFAEDARTESGYSNADSELSDSHTMKPNAERGELIHALLKAQSNPFLEDDSGHTAFHFAMKHGDGQATFMSLLEGTRIHYKSIGGQNYEAVTRTLRWAAEKQDRHEIVKSLLSGPDLWVNEANTDAQLPPESSCWQATEWAAYRGIPWILYRLLASFQELGRPGEIESATLIAEQALERSKALEYQGKGSTSRNPVQPMDAQALGNKKRSAAHGDAKPNMAPDRSDRQVVLDLLRNPPFTSLAMQRKELFPPKPSPDTDDIRMLLKDWTASIVYFYNVKDAEPSFLHRDRSVWDVLYDKGPDRIMTDAKSRLRKLLAKRPGQADETEEVLKNQAEYLKRDTNATVRWVHLPANNVSLNVDLSTTCFLADAEGLQKSDGLDERKYMHQLVNWVRVTDHVPLCLCPKPGD